MSFENNKMLVDIENLFKQNVNDLSAIKELYEKLKEVEEKFLQIKYIDSTLANKLKKEYEKLKKIILDENIQVKLTNDIETINEKLTNDIETINSHLDTKANKTFITPEEFGAKGDGISDDTKAFQDAINFAKSNKCRIECYKDKTYVVKKQGSKIVNFGKTSNHYDYALIIYDNTYINLNGATIKNTESDYSSIFINQSMFNNTSNIFNKNITITNGNIEMDCMNITPKTNKINNAIHLFFVDGATLTNLTFNNVMDGAIGGHCNKHFHIDNIKINTVKGNGLALGVCTNSDSESRLIDSYIGNIYVENVLDNVSPKVSNPFIGCLKNVTINSIEVINSCMGIKIQDDSENVNIGSIIFDGGVNSTQNSGLKIQGLNDTTYTVKNIKVSNLYCKNCVGNGLYIQNADGVNINNYTGENNSISNDNYDVWIHKNNIFIDNIYSKYSNGGVQVRPLSENVVFGNVIIEDCNGIAFSDSGNMTDIKMLKVINQGTSYNTTKVYGNYNSTSKSTINVINHDTKNNINSTIVSDKVTVKELIKNNSHDTEMIITLSSGTYTDVINDNFIYVANGSGGFMTSLLEITNINSTIPIIRYSNITNGFRLWHTTATGTEKVLVKIKGMKVFSTAL